MQPRPDDMTKEVKVELGECKLECEADTPMMNGEVPQVAPGFEHLPSVGGWLQMRRENEQNESSLDTKVPTADIMGLDRSVETAPASLPLEFTENKLEPDAGIQQDSSVGVQDIATSGELKLDVGEPDAVVSKDVLQFDDNEVEWQAQFESAPSKDIVSIPVTRELSRPVSGTSQVEMKSPSPVSSSPFSALRLAPPPSPMTKCSVGLAVPTADVVVIEDLEVGFGKDTKETKEAKPKKVGFEGPAVVEDDDEESLLGGDLVRTPAQIDIIIRKVHDGLDSPSDSDAERAQSGDVPLFQNVLPKSSAPVPQSQDRSAQSQRSIQQGSLVQQAVGSLSSVKPGAKSHIDEVEAQPVLMIPSVDKEVSTVSTPRIPTDGKPVKDKTPHGDKVDGSPTQWSGASLLEVDAHVESSLDAFFSNETLGQRVVKEVMLGTKIAVSTDHHAAKIQVFQVRVPKPYPGIQYRKTKRLDDKYDRFAKHGSRVTGQVEDGGTWLRVNARTFLPMKVGPIQILELVPDAQVPNRSNGGQNPSSMWSWCMGCPNTDSEVVVGQNPAINMQGLMDSQAETGRDREISAAPRPETVGPANKPSGAHTSLAANQSQIAGASTTAQPDLIPEARSTSELDSHRCDNSMQMENLPLLTEDDSSRHCLSGTIDPFSDPMTQRLPSGDPRSGSGKLACPASRQASQVMDDERRANLKAYPSHEVFEA